MTEAEVRDLRKELEILCTVHGVWVDITEKKHPDLKDIILTISLRVTK